MKTVEIVLYITLGKYNPHTEKTSAFKMHLPCESTVEYLLKELKIPSQLTERLQVIINNRCMERNYCPKDGEKIIIIPPIAGG